MFHTQRLFKERMKVLSTILTYSKRVSCNANAEKGQETDRCPQCSQSSPKDTEIQKLSEFLTFNILL